MVKPAAKQTVTTYNSHSCPKQRCFFSSSFHLLFLPFSLLFLFFSSSVSLLFLFFSILIPSFFFFPLLFSSSFSSSFHPLPESNFLLFFLSIFRSTFYHHLFDVMRLQRYAFIGQMTLLSSKSSGNPDDGGRKARFAHVNPTTSSDTGAL